MPIIIIGNSGDNLRKKGEDFTKYGERVSAADNGGF
jgi:hypothetical protein